MGKLLAKYNGSRFKKKKKKLLMKSGYYTRMWNVRIVGQAK